MMDDEQRSNEAMTRPDAEPSLAPEPRINTHQSV